jgi:hypothetical protein
VSTAARLGAAAGMLVVALLLAVYAHDVWRWQRAVEDADARARLGRVAPAAWRADTLLPASWSRARLGLDDDLTFRRATAAALAHVDEHGNEDNEKRRGIIETGLGRIVRHDTNSVRAAQAANILGVLLYNDPISPDQAANAYQDPQQGGPADHQTPEDRAEAQFITAVRLDPANENAARNLELMLRRPGPPPQRGAPKAAAGEHLGNKGSGAREAGHGY